MKKLAYNYVRKKNRQSISIFIATLLLISIILRTNIFAGKPDTLLVSYTGKTLSRTEIKKALKNHKDWLKLKIFSDFPADEETKSNVDCLRINFSGAKIQEQEDLSGETFTGANLRNADLKGVGMQ